MLVPLVCLLLATTASASTCPNAGATCTPIYYLTGQDNISSVGDGYCDDLNNNCACDWDRGDCCDESFERIDSEPDQKYLIECPDCTGGLACLDCMCKDPFSIEKECRQLKIQLGDRDLESPCLFNCSKTCGKQKHVRNKICNPENNHCGCNWDGGDCCGFLADENERRNQYSICMTATTDCRCQDPTSERYFETTIPPRTYATAGERTTRDINATLPARTPSSNILPGCSTEKWRNGDFYCDAGNNNAECGWDKREDGNGNFIGISDCCIREGDDVGQKYATCQDTPELCQCLDPDFSDTTASQTTDRIQTRPDRTTRDEKPGCGQDNYVGDSFCDASNNNAECGWDKSPGRESDCCAGEIPSSCTDPELCTCLDPEFTCDGTQLDNDDHRRMFKAADSSALLAKNQTFGSKLVFDCEPGYGETVTYVCGLFGTKKFATTRPCQAESSTTPAVATSRRELSTKNPSKSDTSSTQPLANTLNIATETSSTVVITTEIQVSEGCRSGSAPALLGMILACSLIWL